MLTFFSSSNTFFLMLFLWFIGALGALLLGKNDQHANWWGSGFGVLGSVAGILSSLTILLGGSQFSFKVASSLPLLSISFKVDTLSAFFIFIISLIGFFVSIYALGYIKHYYKKYNIGVLGFFYNILLASMIMVVSSNNLLFFLIVWELMSLSSYFLVVFEHKEKESVKAGFLYLIMTHIGTACILFAFLLLFGTTKSMDFGTIGAHIELVSPLIRNSIFILALIGFGVKAGIIPLHIWLPSAHPAAPSHVSALMSGVMIKTGIYMLIRIYLVLMPSAPLWWGIIIILLGALSSILGVLYALTEHDIKKLLAFHSIENIGIILIGLGSSLIFRSLGMVSFSHLALIASLFHTLNHAVFKSLLFMGAGLVISETHTRNMEEYGGLIRFMPQTAVFFLIGSMAISALPPLNGFFSEWLTYQALFKGIMVADSSVRWVFIVATGSLAFTGGLAAMCFVKVFGMTFLARPRSKAVIHAKEEEISTRIGMGALASLTLIIGLSAGAITHILSNSVDSLHIFQSFNPAFSTVSLPLIFCTLIAVLLLTYGGTYILSGKRKITYKTTWDCGSTLDSRMEITATGFARSIITILEGILKPTKQISVEYHDENIRYFQKTKTVELGFDNIYHSYFYQPAHLLTSKLSHQVKKIQNGNINAYIFYILTILIALLLVINL